MRANLVRENQNGACYRAAVLLCHQNFKLQVKPANDHVRAPRCALGYASHEVVSECMASAPARG
jgi:hypothetical protein